MKRVHTYSHRFLIYLKDNQLLYVHTVIQLVLKTKNVIKLIVVNVNSSCVLHVLVTGFLLLLTEIIITGRVVKIMLNGLMRKPKNLF